VSVNTIADVRPKSRVADDRLSKNEEDCWTGFAVLGLYRKFDFFIVVGVGLADVGVSVDAIEDVRPKSRVADARLSKNEEDCSTGFAGLGLYTKEDFFIVVGGGLATAGVSVDAVEDVRPKSRVADNRLSKNEEDCWTGFAVLGL
jgi:hypothetical protein